MSSPPACAFCGREQVLVRRLLVQGLAAICSLCLGDALGALRAAVSAPLPGAGKSPYLGEPTAAVHNRTAALGFTGDICRECGSFSMVRTGTCATCIECGASDGCG